MARSTKRVEWLTAIDLQREDRELARRGAERNRGPWISG